MTATAYLPHVVENVPVSWVFQPGGMLRNNVRGWVEMGVVRVIAGPTKCHVWIDVQRPYHLPIDVQQ